MRTLAVVVVVLACAVAIDAADCNGHGKVVDGHCVCDPMYLFENAQPADDCKRKANGIQLDKYLNVRWLANRAADYIEFNLFLATWQCWAGIGLRKNADKLMDGSDFLVGEFLETGEFRAGEFHPNELRARHVGHPWRNQDSDTTVFGAFGWKTSAGVMYSFRRKITVPGNQWALDLSQVTAAKPVYMIYAYCDPETINGTLDWHGESRSQDGTNAVLVSNLLGQPCDQYDCSGNGVCNDGMCMCNKGPEKGWYMPPSCATKGNGIDLIKDQYEFRWSNARDANSIDMSLFISQPSCWAGMAIRRTPEAHMSDADYYVGQWTDDMTPIVGQWSPNTAKTASKGHPIEVPANISSIKAGSIGAQTVGSVGSSYWWTRSLAGPAANTFDITSGSTYYIIWAHCNATGYYKFNYHFANRTQSNADVQSIIFFGSPDNNSGFPSWAYFAIGAGALVIVAFVGYCVCKRRGEKPLLDNQYARVDA